MGAPNTKPARIGKYESSVIGRGGMGVVYQGIDSRIGRPVAIKVHIFRTANDQTPVRLELPAGRYKVQMQGPDGEQQELAVEVPKQGGNSYFVLFRKPETRRFVTMN